MEKKSLNHKLEYFLLWKIKKEQEIKKKDKKLHFCERPGHFFRFSLLLCKSYRIVFSFNFGIHIHQSVLKVWKIDQNCTEDLGIHYSMS